ncbi:transglycosylase SLT domain-containing protein [Cytobacillus firmus]|uniref:Soluble lytic murein transglycosylase n=1 Tax=Cytobacillus firmus DS1 TaxID=1307436 RepID=W7KVD8_CYTFI|nr:transglycosylase SLT domain-containing protein [Cytobacillus firmus]EWG11455.1 soluble lytic murein transglycosylase [Cytobacillus firmus DS1]
MLNRKGLKVLLSTSLIFPAAAVVNVSNTEAASITQIENAVQKSVSTSQILRRACSIEWSGDGVTRPYAEYNAAKKAYSEAIKLVNTLSSSKKQAYLAKLDESQLQIKRAVYYIDAISAGKKIEAKKQFLQSQLEQGILSSETVKAYHELSYEIKKQAALLDPVYGRTTREAIRANFKESAEALRDELSYSVTVKMALDQVSASLAKGQNDTVLKEAKKILMFLEVTPQETYKKQLRTEWDALKGEISESIKDAEYKDLSLLNDQVRELRELVKPGVSDAKVPALYDSAVRLSQEIKNPASKQMFTDAIKNEMKQLQVPIEELKHLLTTKAAAAGIPPELVKAIAITENGAFQQFTERGEVFKSPDNGYGIMQVTPLDEHDDRYDWEKAKYDIGINIETGIQILLEKWNYSGSRIPVVNDGNKAVLENWYFAIMAYNGLSKFNDPNFSEEPYQLKVYSNISKWAQVDAESINKDDLEISYNPSTGQAIFSSKMKYTTDKQTPSTQLFKKGDSIVISGAATFRDKPSTAGSGTSLAKGTRITILDGPIEDNNKYNLFSWYKVSVNGKEGFAASVGLK